MHLTLKHGKRFRAPRKMWFLSFQGAALESWEQSVACSKSKQYLSVYNLHEYYLDKTALGNQLVMLLFQLNTRKHVSNLFFELAISVLQFCIQLNDADFTSGSLLSILAKNNLPSNDIRVESCILCLFALDTGSTTS